MGRVRVADAGRPAGQDDAHGLAGGNLRRGNAPWHYFGIHMVFPNPPGDQLGVLPAEIQDDDFLMVRQGDASFVHLRLER